MKFANHKSKITNNHKKQDICFTNNYEVC